MAEQEQNGANFGAKRRTFKRKATIIPDLIKGTTPLTQAVRTYDLSPEKSRNA